jgi:hypothetical protein
MGEETEVCWRCSMCEASMLLPKERKKKWRNGIAHVRTISSIQDLFIALFNAAAFDAIRVTRTESLI